MVQDLLQYFKVFPDLFEDVGTIVLTKHLWAEAKKSSFWQPSFYK